MRRGRLDITSLEAATSNQPNETVDLSGRVAALEQRVARVEAMTEVVTAIRAEVAAIAEGVDPALARHVAGLADTVENHGLLLARLLDKDAGQ
jgi:hypothetical protein